MSARPSPLAIAFAALLDTVWVTGFALTGRASHAREATLGGLWETSWPFLTGLALSWLIARAWRAPAAPLRSGLPLAVGTLVIGMLLRAAVGQGTALPFVLVAAGTLLAGLVGWRLIAALVSLRGKRARAARAGTHSA